MSTLKRDALAGSAAFAIPVAIDELDNALRFVEEGNLPEVVKAIEQAQSILQPLVQLSDGACTELRGT